MEPRYLGGFLVIFWLALFSAPRYAASAEMKRIGVAVSIAVLVSMGTQVACKAAKDLDDGMRDANGVQWVVAEKLEQMGLARGDTVAVAGRADYAAWAYIAGLSIVASTDDASGSSFWWAADSQAKTEVFQAFAKTGAKAVVADRVPLPNWSGDWQRLGQTPYYVHFLTRP